MNARARLAAVGGKSFRLTDSDVNSVVSRRSMSQTFVATAGLETTTLEEGAILFHPKSGKFVMLNRSAALVWAELATPKTAEELAQKLTASFEGVAPATAETDVQSVLARLRELEIVAPADSQPS